ncbi:MAG: response regulator [Yoonia sp.]|uniref:response regulator n=1 Tax=Yoonia sp. TaxID=2212373 RepID=UPI003EF397B2
MIISQVHLIEDSDDEVFIARLLLEAEGIGIEILHYADLDTFQTYLANDDTTDAKLILVDMNMPTMRGDTVIEILRARTDLDNAIIGMCSGSEDPADKRSAFDAGAVFFAQKPVDRTCLQCICDQVGNLKFKMDSAKGELLALEPK